MSELLDLATVVDRDTVRIRTKRNPNGNVYELLNLEEFGAYEFAILQSRRKKTADLDRADRKMTPAEKRTATKAVKDVLAMIVIDLEPSVLAEIDPIQATKILGVWGARYLDDGAAEGEDSASPSTTAGSSPDSKRSTAATPRTGSTSRGGN